jgi:subtilisin
MSNENDLSRRAMLQATVGAVGVAGTTGLASASSGERVEVNVGYRGSAGKQVVAGAASSVKRDFAFDAVTMEVPTEALQGLRRRPEIRYVEPNGQMRAVAETTPWGIDRVDADLAIEGGDTGDGADIAIVDTGIDADHPDLEPHLGDGTAYVSCDGCATAWDDDNGHGTHCAGTAAAVANTEGVVGVAPGATLHAVKVLASDGYGYYSDIAAGIEWTADKGYDVASLSLGGSSGSYTLQDAVQYATDRGVTVVGAAGNSGPCSDCVIYPAAYPEVVAVSATNSYDDLASFSSTGPEVELAAPGRSIYSTLPGGSYGYYSGTSMACPHVAGAAAQLMAAGYSNTEARDRLAGTAEDVGFATNESGNGLLDVEAAVSDGNSDTPVAVSTDAASSVGETTATLSGSLDDLGGAESADVAFEYREAGTSGTTTTTATTETATGTVSTDVSGLAAGTDYEFRITATASDGDADTGTFSSFTTVTADTSVVVSTNSASAVSETTATLAGSIDDLGGADSADVTFEYAPAGGSLSNSVSAGTVSSAGSVSADVSGLSSGTDYEFRIAATASDGDTDTGGVAGFTTDADTPVVVSTGSASPVSETTATLAGSVDDLGGADSADVTFEYGPAGGSLSNSVSAGTVSTTGSVDASVSGLSASTDYEFRTTASASDGDTDTGSVASFTTDTDPSVAVTTDTESSVGETTATLNATVETLGGASSADVTFEYGPAGEGLSNTVSAGTVSSTGSVSASVSGLAAGTGYEFRAVADASDGDTDTGGVEAFTTDSEPTESAPTVEGISTASRSNPALARFRVDWAVADADGDLSTVEVTLADRTGVVASDTTRVSGGSATATSKLKTHAKASNFDLTVTVTDRAGNTSSKSTTVSR